MRQPPSRWLGSRRTARSGARRAGSAAGSPTTARPSSRRRPVAITCTSPGPARGRTGRSSRRMLMGLEDAIGVSFVDPIRDDEPAGRSPAASTSTRSTASSSWRRPTRATDAGYDARVTRPGAVGQAVRRDRLQRVGGHPADARRPCSRRWPTHPVELYPERAARRDRRRSTSTSTTTSTTPSTRPASRAARTSTSARSRALFATLDELDARLADRRFLFGDAPARDRLAPVHHAGALRRRLPDPLQVLAAQADRVRAPVAVRARSLPVARRRRDGLISTRSAPTTTAPTR